MASLSTAEAAANTLTNAGVAALSTRLGVTVEIIATIAVAMQHFQVPSPQPPPPPSPEPSPPPPTRPPPPSSPPVPAIQQADGAAVGVVLGLTGVIIFIPALFVTAKLSRRSRRQSPDRRPPQGPKGGQRQSETAPVGSHRPEQKEFDSETAVSQSVSYPTATTRPDSGPTATTQAFERTPASETTRTIRDRRVTTRASVRTPASGNARGSQTPKQQQQEFHFETAARTRKATVPRLGLRALLDHDESIALAVAPSLPPPPRLRSELEIWLKGPEETLAVLSPAARSLLKQRQAATSPNERRSRTDSLSELRREETAGRSWTDSLSELRREETAGAASPSTEVPPASVAYSPGGPAWLIAIASAPGHSPGHVAQLNAQLVGSSPPRMPWFLHSPIPRQAEADLTTPKPRRPAPAETVASTASAPALARASTPAALARARASTPASALTPSRSRGETIVYYL